MYIVLNYNIKLLCLKDIVNNCVKLSFSSRFSRVNPDF